MKDTREKILQKLLDAESVVYFTGAGISAESGIATFRGAGGIWNKLKPEELANFDAFLRNPDMVWEWYQYRRSVLKDAQPNAAHLAIAQSENIFQNVTVVTQNVDNLHKRAGSTNIYELHGNIERNFCVRCHTYYNLPDVPFENKAPKCECGGLIRPDVVWFGEMLPQEIFSASEDAAMNCDVMFIIGTSAVVYPAARIPGLARRHGAYLIEINIEPTEISYTVDASLMGKAGEILPGLLNDVKSRK